MFTANVCRQLCIILFYFPFFEVDLLDFDTLIVTVFTLFHLAPSGSISWVTATPADVVKSRMQADTQLSRKYKGIVDCILHSYKTEGAQVNTRVRANEQTRVLHMYLDDVKSIRRFLFN